MNEIDKRVPAHEMMLADLRIFIPNYLELSAKHGQGWIGQKSMSDWFHETKRVLTDLNRIVLPLKELPNIVAELEEHLAVASKDASLCDLLISSIESMRTYDAELNPTTSDS